MSGQNRIVDYWFEEAAKPAPNTPDPRDVRGVILEVGLDVGVDVLAAFACGRARFLNHTGDISMWEGGPGATANLVTELLVRAEPIVQNAAAPHGRLPAPEDGTVRISVFTGAGLHLAEGPMNQFADHAVFDSGVALMNALEGID